MAEDMVIIDDSEFEIDKIVFNKSRAAVKAEMEHNGGDFKAAFLTVQKTFDWNMAEREAKEEYNAKHRKNPIR